MKPDYIFIVGLPRTGTKLIQNILRNSKGINYETSGETFFLGHFIRPGVRHKIQRIGDMSQDQNVRRLVDYLYSGKPDGNLWKRLKNGSSNADKEKLLRQLLASERRDRDIYRIILQMHVTSSENTVLGDKTPANLYHVPLLLRWFPRAKIIHTFRDPRAILASEWRKRMRTNLTTFPQKFLRPFYSCLIVLHVTVTWLYAVRLHYKYEQHYPGNYYLSKFEDLVADPEQSVRALCAFLGLEFDPAMLIPPHVGSSYSPQAEPGFDLRALSRWQDFLPRWMETWILLWCRRYMRDFGYLPS